MSNEQVSEEMLLEKNPEKKVAYITFNRPEKLNCFTLAHWTRMNELVLEIMEDDDVKSIVFKGAGRSFCSGHDVGDLGVMYGIGTTGKERRLSQRARLFKDASIQGGGMGLGSILYCHKATIAQVHGYCYGGGLNISNACDITIAADNTMFTHPGYRYIGPTTDIWLLSQHVGFKKAKEMTLTGIPVDAQEALQIGLVNKVVPLDKLEEEVDKMVVAISRMPIDGIVMGKMQFRTALEASGAGIGMLANGILHTLQTNIRYEEGEFNLFKERRNKGIKGAILTRKEHYEE